MRLWHKELIPYLPRQQLLGQWRECCAIKRNIEKNGTPNHVLVNKVMQYPPEHFNGYAYLVYNEITDRGYSATWERFAEEPLILAEERELFDGWHNDRYLRQCLYNLQEKADCGAIPVEEWERITYVWPEMGKEGIRPISQGELKRMTPAEAEREGGGSSWWYVCPACHGTIDEYSAYCKYCGQALKQIRMNLI